MITVLLACASLILLVPILLLLDLGMSKKGKLLLGATAFCISGLSLMAEGSLPLQQSILIALLLVLLSGLMYGKRLGSFIFATHGGGNKPAMPYFDHEAGASREAAGKELNIAEKFTEENDSAADEVIIVSKTELTPQPHSGADVDDWLETMEFSEAEAAEEAAKPDLNEVQSDGSTGELSEIEQLLEMAEVEEIIGTSPAVPSVPDAAGAGLEEAGIPKDFILQDMDSELHPLEDEAMKHLHIEADSELQPLPLYDLDAVNAETGSEDALEAEVLPPAGLDEDVLPLLLLKEAENEQHEEKEDEFLPGLEEASKIGSVSEELEELPQREEALLDHVPDLSEETDDSMKDIPAEEPAGQDDQDDHNFESVLIEEEKAEAPITRRQIDKGVLQTILSGIAISRDETDYPSYIRLVKQHMHPGLSPQDYYVFAGLLIEEYIRQDDAAALEPLLKELQERYLPYPIILSEIEFLYEAYCR
ncbi:hypothetical protein V1498_05700 [Peribacillus sp. SCS-26]|uniref:hypothetical protein n=1 Tax=Paraperibacillus marinus TaxID=3115295 RepID=UPI003905E92E